MPSAKAELANVKKSYYKSTQKKNQKTNSESFSTSSGKANELSNSTKLIDSESPGIQDHNSLPTTKNKGGGWG